MDSSKTWKFICEIRYPHAALLVDNMGHIAARWQWKYDLTDWHITALDNVSIRNRNRTTVLTAGVVKSAVSMEIPESYEKFLDITTSFFVYLGNSLDIKQISRIGFRIINLNEYNNFDRLVANMRKKLYKLGDEEWDILGGPPVEVNFPLNLKLGKNQVNFNLMPLRKETLVSLFDSPTVREILPKIALLIDFDLYATNPEFKKNDIKRFLVDFLEFGKTEVQNKAIEFVEYFERFE